tara:strand:+ start:1014 stop:1679 length:666 start_codon:yes stop_codon:yes gene_type:complete
MHRRDVLKTTLASMLGVTFGFAGTVKEGNFFETKKCSIKYPTSSSKDIRRFRPSKWGGQNTIDGHTHLTYHIWNRDADLEESVWDAEIAKAFDCWTKVTNLSFEAVSETTTTDIIIGVSNRKRSGFGEEGDILAWAQMPTSRNFDGLLWSMFDLAENWTVNVEEYGVLLRAVCAHEIGHLLGLGHSQHATALMYPYYAPHIQAPQLLDDIPRIQKLYGRKA